METLGVVGLFQKRGHNVTTKPDDSPVHMARRKWQRKEGKRREGLRRPKKKNNGRLPFPFMLTLSTCVNIHEHCSYIILP